MTIAPPSSIRPRPVLADLGPLAQLRAGRLPERLVRLYVGLVAYGLSIALMVRGRFGLAPWSTMESGLIRHVPLTLGQAVVAVSFVVLLLWIPLREVPGLATVSNAILVGVSADASLGLLGSPDALAARLALTVGGIVLCGFATALYIGAQLGRGPRDGLMTGLARRTGWSLRAVRTGLEVTVVVLGLVLGGAVGVGTVLFALTIGPIAQALLPFLLVDVGAPIPTTEAAPPGDR